MPAPPDDHTGYTATFEPAMELALAEAAAAQPAGGNLEDADVPVGAVVLNPGGTVIARGHNRREAAGDPTAHAEMEAIRAAARAIGSRRLDGCSLVVTLEPCTMCAGAVLLARLDRLVYGADDPKAGAAGSLWDVLHDRRLGPTPEVIRGVLGAECSALLRDFFALRRAKQR
ncbi:MAG: nucleoside deaminase [Streptosporangiaceae bacterium]